MENMTENRMFVQNILAIFTIPYLIKPYQTCLNVLLGPAHSVEKRWLKTNLGSEVSIFGNVHHNIPYQTMQNLAQFLTS